MRRSALVAAVIVGWGGATVPAAGQTQRVVISEGDTIAVTVTGAGPAVVIVPGLLGSAFSFRKVVPRLVAAGRKVVLIEPLGTGSSARPERADYSLEAQAARVGWAMHHTGVHRAVLLCHSVGASICYRAALQSPERVTGIVALNGGPDEQAATSGLRLALRFAPLARLLGAAGTIRSRLRDGLVKNSADPSWVTEEVVDGYTRSYGKDLDAVLRSLRGIASASETEPLAPRLRDIDVPVVLLVGAGSKSGAISQPAIDVLAGALPDLRVDRVAGAGQYIQEEKPQAVVDAVLRLCEEVSALHGPRQPRPY